MPVDSTGLKKPTPKAPITLKFNKNTAEENEQAIAAIVGGSLNVREAKGLQQIALNKLVPYHSKELGYDRQPFQVVDNDELHELAEDIRKNGIYEAVIVRQIDIGQYMILSGHRRCRAANIAGLATVPCVVRDVDEAQAALIVTQTNLLRREKILPSERARAYQLRLEAMKKKAGRPSIENCAQFGHNFDGQRSRDVLAQEIGVSKNQIQRFIRLNFLCDELLEAVDLGDIPVNGGVDLSYISTDLQQVVYDYWKASGRQMGLALASELRFTEPQTAETLINVLMPQTKIVEDKPPKIKPRVVKVKFESIQSFFPADIKDKDIMKTIRQALALYFKTQQADNESAAPNAMPDLAWTEEVS